MKHIFQEIGNNQEITSKRKSIGNTDASYY